MTFLMFLFILFFGCVVSYGVYRLFFYKEEEKKEEEKKEEKKEEEKKEEEKKEEEIIETKWIDWIKVFGPYTFKQDSFSTILSFEEVSTDVYKLNEYTNQDSRWKINWDLYKGFFAEDQDGKFLSNDGSKLTVKDEKTYWKIVY